MNSGETASVVDERLDALGNTSRRTVLHSLLRERRDGGTTIDIDSFRQGPTGEEQVITLGHVHLPKLVDMGFVVVDGEARQVAPGERFDELVPLLEHLEMETNDPAVATPGDAEATNEEPTESRSR